MAVRFIDETAIASGESDELPTADSFQDDWPDSHSEDSGTVKTIGTILTDATAVLPPIQAYPTPPEAAGTIALVRPQSPTDRFIPHDDHVVSPPRTLPQFQHLTVLDPISVAFPMMAYMDVDNHDPEVQAMRAQIYHERDVWPLQSREEAMLFRHFVRNLSIWVRRFIYATSVVLGEQHEADLSRSSTCVTLASLSRRSCPHGQDAARCS